MIPYIKKKGSDLVQTKRIWILILALAGIACLTACAGRKQPESTSQMEKLQEESLQDAHVQDESPDPSSKKPLEPESAVSTEESVSEGVETYRGFERCLCHALQSI